MRTNQATVLLTGKDAAELRRGLARLDVNVPLRTEGRTSEHTERYAIAHLLATLPMSHLPFPLTLIHRDRPDFFIEGRSGRIAIEHVEVVSENEAKKAALREEDDDDRMHFIARAVPGERTRSTQRLLEEIERETQVEHAGDGWVGDSVEREWADAMAYFAIEKARASGKKGFQRGDETRLLMYDNWRLPAVEPEGAAAYFVAHASAAEIFAAFHRVYVLDGSGVWEFSAGMWEYYALKRPRDATPSVHYERRSFDAERGP
jgi:hypothetical protein